MRLVRGHFSLDEMVSHLREDLIEHIEENERQRIERETRDPLESALGDATELANLSSDMDWGRVSDIACNIVHNLERIQKLLSKGG